MIGTAKRVGVATLVVIAIVDALARRRVPRSLGLLLHYLALAGLLALFLWIVVPRAVDQVQSALGGTTQAQIHREATSSRGIKHEILTAIED